MRNYITGLIIIFITTNLISQISDYKISEYLYPNVKRTYLRISPDIGFNDSRNELRDDRLDIFTRLYSLYTNRYYNEKIQMINEGTFSGDYRLREEDGSDIDRQRDLNGRYEGNIYYYFKKKWFVGGDVQIRFQNEKSIEPNAELRRNVLWTYLEPKFGLGRLELVTDMWHAGSILEILEKEGLLLKSLNRADINDFAKIVSKAKNNRNLDLRFENIEELELLYNYLIENGISENSPRVAFLLRDAYVFEAFVVREHGKRVTLQPYFNRFQGNRIFNSDESSSVSDVYGVRFSFEDKKAKSKLVQFDQSYSTTFRQIFRNPSSEPSNMNSNVLVDINYVLGFYLNRRTYLDASLRYYLDINLGGDEITDAYEGYTQQFSWGIGANYYLSPSIRLYASYRYSFYSTIIVEDNRSVNTKLSLGLHYFAW